MGLTRNSKHCLEMKARLHAWIGSTGCTYHLVQYNPTQLNLGSIWLHIIGWTSSKSTSNIHTTIAWHSSRVTAHLSCQWEKVVGKVEKKIKLITKMRNMGVRVKGNFFMTTLLAESSSLSWGSDTTMAERFKFSPTNLIWTVANQKGFIYTFFLPWVAMTKLQRRVVINKFSSRA